MNDAELKQVFVETILEIAPEADFGSLDPNDALREQLDLDSMDFLNVMIGLHEKLGVDIPETDYPRLFTLAGALDYLREKLPT
jgi:acyl carrier protein